jgi:hypothetical protein
MDLVNYAVTGTRHGSIVMAPTEGHARRIFHDAWGGESIVCMRIMHGKWLQKPDFEAMSWDKKIVLFVRNHDLAQTHQDEGMDTDLPF